MQPLIPPVDAARRARAAMAYAGLDAKDVAQATDIGKATLDRITSRTNPQNGTIDRLWTIADACQVPRSFMEHGFATEPAIEAPADLAGRLASLEAEVRLLARRVGTGAPAPPAGLGRRAAGSSPTAGSPGVSDSDPEAGSQPGSAG